MHLTMPNGTHDRSQFRRKRDLFSGLGEDHEIQRKGVYGGKKIRDYYKAGSLAIGADDQAACCSLPCHDIVVKIAGYLEFIPLKVLLASANKLWSWNCIMY